MARLAHEHDMHSQGSNRKRTRNSYNAWIVHNLEESTLIFPCVARKLGVRKEVSWTHCDLCSF